MAYENLQYKPEDKSADFAVFLQGALIREEGLNNKQAEMEWVLKNRLKFRDIINNHPELRDMYISNHEAALELVKKLMKESEVGEDEALRDELAN